MKTLTLLVCICALSACFSVSEGHKKRWKTHHKKNSVRQHIVRHRLPFHPKPQTNQNMLLQNPLLRFPPRYQKPSRPIKIQPMPKLPWLPKCPVKSNTVVNSNTAEASTQIPSLSPTSTSNKITESPGVTSFTQNPTTISENINTGSSSAIPSLQPSPALPETTTAPPTSSPTLQETTAAAPTSSPALQETTAAPPTSSPALPDTTASPPTSSLTTPAPQPSSAPLETTSPPNTTPNPSPTTETTAAPTTPATIQTTTVGQTTSPFTQNQNNAFWQFIYEILKYISGVIPNK